MLLTHDRPSEPIKLRRARPHSIPAQSQLGRPLVLNILSPWLPGSLPFRLQFLPDVPRGVALFRFASLRLRIISGSNHPSKKIPTANIIIEFDCM